MTAQVHEILIIDGEKTSMAFCPKIPEGHPRIVRLNGDEIDQLRQNIGAEEEEELLRWQSLFSTACWRNYLGTWEIKDGRFYLVKLRGMYRLEGNEPVFADWFTGALRIPKGKMLQYVHMGFGTVYEQELHISIRNGLIIRSRVIDNRGKLIDQLRLGSQNLPGGENRFPGDTEDHFFASFIVRCPACRAQSNTPDPDKTFDLVGLCVAPDTDYVLCECKCGGCKTRFSAACWSGTSTQEFDPSEFDQQLLQRYQAAVDAIAALKGEERNIGGMLTDFKGISDLDADTEFLNLPANENLRTSKVNIPIEALSLARGVRKAAINSPEHSSACTIGPLNLIVSVNADAPRKLFSHVLRLTITDSVTGAPISGPPFNFGMSLVLAYEEFIHWPSILSLQNHPAQIEIPWRT